MFFPSLAVRLSNTKYLIVLRVPHDALFSEIKVLISGGNSTCLRKLQNRLFSVIVSDSGTGKHILCKNS